ncbi:MAG: hypothetical protein II744_02525 [Eubacterium sp.]|nr:hypothetical protein [Eubacterium sp.]
MNISFKVENQLIERTDEMTVVADSRNYLYADFEFSPEWTGTVTAVFKNEGVSYTAVLDSENKCAVPWEVITEGRFSVSCFCGNRITANRAYVEVLPSGYEEGETPAEPTPDVYEELVELFEDSSQKADSVYTAYINGELKGEKGDPGPSVHNYSETEQVIGSWVNGKPVYEKTVAFTLDSDGWWWNYNCFADVETAIKCEGLLNTDINGDDGTLFFNGDYRAAKSTDNMCLIKAFFVYSNDPEVKGLYICGLSGNSAIYPLKNESGYVTLRYTKTTDTAVSG